jgi:hypothetical protein
MNRYAQMILWIVLAPVLGLLQGVTSILLYEQMRSIRSADTWKTFALISVFYGACWFVPSMVLSDLMFLRRALTARELSRYVGVCAACALFVGVVSPGYLILIGYPITAFAIMALAFTGRKHPPRA